VEVPKVAQQANDPVAEGNKREQDPEYLRRRNEEGRLVPDK
jgi:hypothetical protein